MDAKKPPLPLLILGWAAIITIPIAFFVFGWRDITLTCRRPSPGAPPTCRITESFAMGLYTRRITVEQATGVCFQVRRGTSPTGAGGAPPPSTVVLATPSGELVVSRGASNVDGRAKAELIRKLQEFLDKPDLLAFRHQARMHSLFGYLGAAGVAGLVFILLAVAWRQVRKRMGRRQGDEGLGT